MTPDAGKRTAGKLWLALPAILLCLADQIVTLLGQPGAYWAGNYSQPLEGAPHGHWLLSRHPAWYITAACCYLLLIAIGIIWLPRLPARMASASLTIGHTWGTCWWMLTFFPGDRGYWICFGLFIFSGILLVLGFERSDAAALGRLRAGGECR